MTTANAQAAPTDDVDPAVLTDLLDFLDDFDQPLASSPPPPASSKSSGLDRSQSPPASTIKANGTTTKPGGAKKAWPKRMERYWIKKHELQALRDETTYLANKLELLRQCARSPAEVRVTSELGVSIRRVVHSHWKRLAAHEKAMREKAERQNAQLRALTQFQKQWNAGLESTLNQLAAMPTELPSAMKTKTTVVVKQKRASWREILVELFREACEFANIQPEMTIDRFDWSNAYLHYVHTRPMLEWTTSFPVPAGDPVSIGDTFWLQTGSYSAMKHMHPVSSVIKRPNVSPPRLHRNCGFKYADGDGRSLGSQMNAVFEMHKLEEAWILTATCSVFDKATSILLITATATTIITKSIVNPGSCIVRAQYRIHDSTDELQVHGNKCMVEEGNIDIKELEAHAQVAAKNWGLAVRAKDNDIQKMLLQASN